MQDIIKITINLILFMCIPMLSGNMDTQKDKWGFYEKSFHKKLAIILFKLKIFTTQEAADFWFNSTGQSWRNAYIGGIKDSSLPNKNKIQYQILGIKFNKPAPLVDAWHSFKLLLIICICLLVALNTPVMFWFDHSAWVRLIYLNLLLVIWWIVFGLSYNGK